MRRLRDLIRKYRARRRAVRRQAKKWRHTHKRGYAKQAHRDVWAIRRLRRLIRKTKRRIERLRNEHQQGVDCYGGVSPQALRDNGKTFIARYVSEVPGKALTRGEAAGYHAYRISIVSIYEEDRNSPLDGYNAGRDDALRAFNLARDAGMPGGDPVILCVDFETSGPSVASYFKGAADALGKERVGVYGSYEVVGWLLDNGIVKYGFQTYAWSDGLWCGAHLEQYLDEQVHIGGVTVDLDRSSTSDFGSW